MVNPVPDQPEIVTLLGIGLPYLVRPWEEWGEGVRRVSSIFQQSVPRKPDLCMTVLLHVWCRRPCRRRTTRCADFFRYYAAALRVH